MADALAAQVYARLVADIVSVRLTPGQALSENELAQEYGVSRTPVREAVQRLRMAGLVDVRPQVGTVVSRIDVDRVREAQFVRETLEAACVEVLMKQHLPVGRADAARLRGAITAQQEAALAGDTLAFVRYDEEMHRTLCELSGYLNVWEMIAPAKVHLDRVRHLSLMTQGLMKRLVLQHKAIVHAVLKGERREAVHLTRSHAQAVLGALIGLADQYPDYFDQPTAGPASA